jgi:uncharacterized SAM-binding protein YcdF (DUF218 family)
LRRFRWLILLAALCAGVYFYPRAILYPMGTYLIQDEGATKCDCMFVLAGDFFGQRILKAAELYRAGMAPKLFVSGPGGVYGLTEDELAINFAKKRGFADVPFLPLPNHGRSTLSEGIEVYPTLRAAGCNSVLVVTSNFHTRRAGKILRRVWPDIQVRMAAAPTDDYDPEIWWTDRNYRKTFFYEWTKTITEWVGL